MHQPVGSTVKIFDPGKWKLVAEGNTTYPKRYTQGLPPPAHVERQQQFEATLHSTAAAAPVQTPLNTDQGLQNWNSAPAPIHYCHDQNRKKQLPAHDDHQTV